MAAIGLTRHAITRSTAAIVLVGLLGYGASGPGLRGRIGSNTRPLPRGAVRVR